MKSVSKAGNILVTGSSGFIGTHMCAELARATGGELDTRELNVLDRLRVEKLARSWDVASVIHMAVPGRVVAPVSFAPGMFATAMEGTLNVLECFAPRAVFTTSTCAAYGNTEDSGAIAGRTAPNPVGLYGFSRTSCESLITSWAVETDNTAIIFRIGNVIGVGCGGLIPYLVGHAVKHPDGSVPARLRGGGRIIRDYIPASHVARILAKAASLDWLDTRKEFFNIGTCRGTANGEIAEIVIGIVAKYGYRLRVEYTPEPALGEAKQAILDATSTTQMFGIAPPTEEAVRDTVAEAVLSRLDALTDGKKAVAAAG